MKCEITHRFVVVVAFRIVLQMCY